MTLTCKENTMKARTIILIAASTILTAGLGLLIFRHRKDIKEFIEEEDFFDDFYDEDIAGEF